MSVWLGETYADDFVAGPDAAVGDGRLFDQRADVVAEDALVLLAQREAQTAVHFRHADLELLHQQQQQQSIWSIGPHILEHVRFWNGATLRRRRLFLHTFSLSLSLSSSL